MRKIVLWSLAVIVAGASAAAAAGHEVWAIDRWREHIDTIRAKGLRLEGASGDRTVKVNATTEAREAGRCDVLLGRTRLTRGYRSGCVRDSTARSTSRSGQCR